MEQSRRRVGLDVDAQLTSVVAGRGRPALHFWILLRLAQCCYQAFCFVGDDGVDSPFSELAHARGTIHGPEHCSLAGIVNLLNQFPLRQVVSRNNPLRWEVAPAFDLGTCVAKKAQRDRRVEVVNCGKHRGKEGGNNKFFLWRVAG